MEAILKIPVWHGNLEDKWVWTKITSGELSVKSAYKELITLEESVPCNEVLGKLWKVKIHNRLKMLLWRIAIELLPTKDKVQRFASNVDPSCHFCGNKVETQIHLFWHCHVARSLWFGSGWGIRLDKIHMENSLALVEFLLCLTLDLVLIEEQSSHFLLNGALILDKIWKLRNAIIYEGAMLDMDSHICGVFKLVKEHWCSRQLSQVNSPQRDAMEWSCLGPGTMKINCDAAIGKDYSVIAAVARDWRGALVFALSKKANTNVPLQVEAKALLWSVQLARSFNGIKVVIEGDSKMCIEALRTQNVDGPWRISSYLTEICRLTSLLSDCSFTWVRREGNHAAH